VSLGLEAKKEESPGGAKDLLRDTRIKTIGLGKSKTAKERGGVEILVYPVGTTVAQAHNESSAKL